MKQRSERAKTSAKAASPRKTAGGSDLEKTLALIKKNPGIRPSEINRALNREESDGLRATLIKRGLIRKVKDGTAMRYYPV
jgi:predicted transcriptional regulator